MVFVDAQPSRRAGRFRLSRSQRVWADQLAEQRRAERDPEGLAELERVRLRDVAAVDVRDRLIDHERARTLRGSLCVGAQNQPLASMNPRR